MSARAVLREKNWTWPAGIVQTAAAHELLHPNAILAEERILDRHLDDEELAAGQRSEIRMRGSAEVLGDVGHDPEIEFRFVENAASNGSGDLATSRLMLSGIASYRLVVGSHAQ